MATISQCPQCRQAVTIPDGLAPAGRVRCPLCTAEYPIGDAMALLPPALVPVATVVVAPAPAELPPVEPEDVAAGVAAAIAAAGHKPDTFGQWDLVDEPPRSDEEAGPDEHPDTGGFSLAEEQDQAEPSGDGQAVVPPAMKTEKASDRKADAAATGLAKPRRKHRRERNPIRDIVGALLGGFLGLSIGYYLLNLIGGAQYDFLDVYLPGIKHTYKHWGTPAPEPAKQPTSPSKTTAAPPSGAVPVAATPAVKSTPTPKPIEKPAGKPAKEPELTAEPPNMAVQPTPTRVRTLPPDYVGPREPPLYDAQKLGDVLKATNEAFVGGNPPAEMSRDLYGKFCRLAEAVTFADASDKRVIDQLQAVETILDRLKDAVDLTDAVARRSAKPLDLEASSPGGVFLAGTVQLTVSKEGLHAAIVQLAMSPNADTMTVTVMSNRPLPFAKGDHVLILGSKIPEPAKNIIGYKGSRPMLVWVGMAVKAI